jgi:hypothetical protein
MDPRGLQLGQYHYRSFHITPASNTGRGVQSGTFNVNLHEQTIRKPLAQHFQSEKVLSISRVGEAPYEKAASKRVAIRHSLTSNAVHS